MNHASEHLATSDRGVVMFRRLLNDGLKAIEGGEDPPGIMRGRENPVFQIGARNQVTTPE